ncbi:tetratricopeptide repeat protein [Streptomyces microflavus]|uniref:tetratricopeptide repeat protein n=1 Tax=Streptomyces microflavus TaxID=1919 RepID=UPI0038662BA0|nr:tetratricopeptide repeat protein [Streptomyces microflavus]
METADQLSSVIGGAVGLLGLAVSLIALRSPTSAAAPSITDGGADGSWVRAAAAYASYRAPAIQAPVRGRDSELANLEGLAAGRDGALVVICGTGGLGKTTLAAQATWQAKSEGRAVFWVRWQDDAARIAHDLTRIAQALGLPETRLHDAQSGRKALVDVVWEHLASVKGWVIVIDNADAPRSLGSGSEPPGSYRGWVRPDGGGLLLVTSRDTARATWGPRARLVPLKALAAGASGTVLRDAAPAAGSPEEAAALGERLGGLPLALDTAGRYLANPTSRYRTFTGYQHALNTEFGDLLGAEHPHADDPEVARTVVRHTFDLSLAQLHDDGWTLARPALFLLALLAPSPVPRAFLTPALLTDATGRSATAAELDAVLAALHQYGLISTQTQPSAESGSEQLLTIGQVVMHPLVQEVIALTEPPGVDRATCYTALGAHLIQIVRDTVNAGRAGWSTARLLAPHLPPLLHRTSHANFIPTRDSLSDLADALQDAGATAERHLLRQCVLDAEAERLGPDHPDTLNSRGNLGLALGDLGRHQEAADLHQQALDECERVLGPDHPHTLTSRHNLGIALHLLGRRQEAADLYQRIVGDRERVLGPDHPDTLTSRNNFGIALNALGRYQQAVDLHQQTLDESERVLGPDHPNTLSSRNNLGLALHGLGRHQEAVDLHQRTLDERARVLGPDHPNTLTSRNNLGLALNALGRYQQAVDLHQQTLDESERVLGPHHPNTLSSRSNLGVAQHRLGRHEEAAENLAQNVADCERVLGPDHPSTLTSRNNLGLVLNGLGRHQDAADLHQQTLADHERVLGPDHPRTLNSRHNLGTALHALGRHQEAADLLERSLADSVRVLGPDHPDTHTSRGILGLVLYRLRRYQEAADIFQQTLADCERVLGADHPQTITSRSNLATARAALARAQRWRLPWRRSRRFPPAADRP